MSETMLTVRYSARPGAMDRVMSLLRRRAFPVTGVTLERTQNRDIARMTVTVERPDAVEQVRRHLQKLPDVLDVSPCAPDTCREYALFRICCADGERERVVGQVQMAGGRIISEMPGYLVVEASGTAEQIDALLVTLDGFGIDEMARTASMALRAPHTGKIEDEGNSDG